METENGYVYRRMSQLHRSTDLSLCTFGNNEKLLGSLMQNQCFHDFDAFAESIEGVESKMLLRNANHRAWSLSVADLQGMPVQVGRLGSGNIARGELRAEGCLLYIPLTYGCEYFANGVPLNFESLAILTPGSEFCVSTRVKHDWCAITLPSDFFNPGGDLAEPLPGVERATVQVLEPKMRLVQQLREMVAQIMQAAHECPGFEQTPTAMFARAELLDVAGQIFSQPAANVPNQKGRNRVPRDEVIARAERLLEQSDGKRVLIGELAAAVDVSERTLRTIFNDYFGVGPVRYLQLRQLHRVRRELRKANPQGKSVSDVLIACGEWEFSRFAARYRLQFGELPSETLRGSNG